MEWIVVIMVVLSILLILVLALVSAANRETEPAMTSEQMEFEVGSNSQFISAVSEWVASQTTATNLDVPVFVVEDTPHRAIVDAWKRGCRYALIVGTDVSFSYVPLWPQPLTTYVSELERVHPRWQILQLCGSHAFGKDFTNSANSANSTESFVVSRTDPETVAYVIHLSEIEHILRSAESAENLLSRTSPDQCYVTRYPLLSPSGNLRMAHRAATYYLDAIFHQLTPSLRSRDLFLHLARPKIRVSRNVHRPEVDLVVAYYRASIDWLWEWLDVLTSMGIVYRVFIYSKWERGWDAIDSLSRARVHRWVDLANIGRCDHTYVYHLIDTWDDPEVAPTTFFLKDATLRPVVGFGQITPEWLTAHLQRCIKKQMSDPQRILKPVGPFIKPSYRAEPNLRKFTMSRYSMPWDQAKNADSFLLAPVSLRPFIHWAQYLFGQRFDIAAITHIIFFGVMMFSSMAARRYSKDIWVRAGLTLSYGGNIEIGHYMERMWYGMLSGKI